MITQNQDSRITLDGQVVPRVFTACRTKEVSKTFHKRGSIDRISLQCWHGPAGAEFWIRFQRFSITKAKPQ
ncbi:MAG: hypothetical protein FWH27_06855 [Planctomycetaceae bacterium]|nr:hypothetical protein [Planctomycetaceae bacterium]